MKIIYNPINVWNIILGKSRYSGGCSVATTVAGGEIAPFSSSEEDPSIFFMATSIWPGFIGVRPHSGTVLTGDHCKLWNGSRDRNSAGGSRSLSDNKTGTGGPGAIEERNRRPVREATDGAGELLKQPGLNSRGRTRRIEPYDHEREGYRGRGRKAEKNKRDEWWMSMRTMEGVGEYERRKGRG